MGAGIVKYPNVDAEIELLRGAEVPELEVITALLEGSVVDEVTRVDGLEVAIAAVRPLPGYWPQLLVGRFALSVQPCSQRDLVEIARAGYVTDGRGAPSSVQAWRSGGEDDANWELWNVIVRSVERWRHAAIDTSDTDDDTE